MISKRFNSDMGRNLAILLLLAGLVMFGIGAFGVYDNDDATDEARHIEDLPTPGFGAFQDVIPGTEVALTGTLVDNVLLPDDVPYTLADLELVACDVRSWHVKNNNTREWETLYRNVPTLSLRMVERQAVGTVTISRPDPEADLWIAGAMHETRIRLGNGEWSEDGNQWMARGFQNGDTVTVVGVATGDLALSPSRLYGGTHAELAAELDTKVERTHGMATGTFVTGGVIAALSAGFLALRWAVVRSKGGAA